MTDKPENKSETPAGGAAPAAVKRDTGPRLLAREFTVPPAWTLGPPPEALGQGHDQPPPDKQTGRPDGGVGHGADPQYQSRPEDMAASEVQESWRDDCHDGTIGGGLPRDTLRETTNNTLRGLQPGPSEEPPRSRPSPVVVPALTDPTPLTVDPSPDAPATAVPEQREATKGEYAAPRPAPRAADHKTLEIETVKLDSAVDPRKQVTERTLRRPASREQVQEITQASSSRRGVLLIALVLGLVALVALFLGLRHESRAQEALAASAQPAPQHTGTPATAATVQATSRASANVEPSAIVSAAAPPAPSSPTPTVQHHAAARPKPAHHKTPAAHAVRKPAVTAHKSSTPATAASASPWVF